MRPRSRDRGIGLPRALPAGVSNGFNEAPIKRPGNRGSPVRCQLAYQTASMRPRSRDRGIAAANGSPTSSESFNEAPIKRPGNPDKEAWRISEEEWLQ